MTTTRPTPMLQWLVGSDAPAERLAMFRIIVGGFVVTYLLIRLPIFVELSQRQGSGFDGVGLFGLVSEPVPSSVVLLVLGLVFLTGIGFITGVWFKFCGPTFALGVVFLTSYRSSWGQLLHFENLFALHTLVVGFSPAADAWTLRRSSPPQRLGVAYGWPLHLAKLIVVSTYVIAGIAKLRYGGVEWIVGDTLRNHVAYSAARLDILGGFRSPIAEFVVSTGPVLPILAGVAVLIELLAPTALVGGRVRTVWVVSTWIMHVGILLSMFVGFGYPLFLAAFAPFYALEELPDLATTRGQRWLSSAKFRQ